MKRHAALQDLARDHFHALVCAQKIRKAESETEISEAAQNLFELWRDDLIYHFREEEEVLIPILSRHISPTEDEDVRKMLDQHAFLRDGIRRLKQIVEVGQDFTEQLKSLGVLLHDHARLEDRIIFGRLESLFTDEDLADVARLSQEYRETWGRPLGPQ